METEKKFCPFKKQIKQATQRDGRGMIRTLLVSDRLGYCSGERCMAYKDGRCLRVEKKAHV